MTILGLNAYAPDSAACLFIDGKLVAAAEEERFRRVAHWSGLPTHAIDYCLREGRIKIGDIDHVAINRNPGIHRWHRFGFFLTHRPHPKFIWQRIKRWRATKPIKQVLDEHYQTTLRAEPHQIEHHLAHLASAFFLSNFNEAACASIDSFGDFTAAALGFGEANKLSVLKRVHFPHSLGIFYSAVTQFLGFTGFGEESKLMALALSGEPTFFEQLRDVVLLQPDGTFRLNLKYFRHHSANVDHRSQIGAPETGTLFRRALAALLGQPRKSDEPLEQRHRDIARSAQTLFEKALFELLHALHKLYPTNNLALAGGCAMNSVANGKILRRTPFKKIFVTPAAGAAGSAIGAAALVNSRLNIQSSKMDSAYLGPCSSEVEVHALLDWRNKQIVGAGCTIAMVPDKRELAQRTARALANEKIVGWFQGRMEFGPRALGNRSILGDPRHPNMRRMFNAKIRPFDSFLAFNLSILGEAVSDWLEQDEDVPFMTHAFHIRSKRRELVPAVTHVDGTGQIQTVHKESNPHFHALISEFSQLTSIPIVLNTVFAENEPMVCYPEEALDCFLRTKMDLLVLEDFLIERPSS